MIVAEGQRDGRNIVFSARLVGRIDQLTNYLVHLETPGLHNFQDLAVLYHRGEPIGADQQHVAGLKIQHLQVNLQPFLPSQRPSDNVAQWVGPRLLAIDEPRHHLLVDPRVIAGELADCVVANQIDATVSDMSDVSLVFVEQDRGNGGSHALALRVFLDLLHQLPVGKADRGLEAVSTQGELLVEPERPSDVGVGAGELDELFDRLGGKL